MNVARAARAAHVRRIVYLGGLHPDGELSPHLRSRAEVGRIQTDEDRIAHKPGNESGAGAESEAVMIGAGAGADRASLRLCCARVPTRTSQVGSQPAPYAAASNSGKWMLTIVPSGRRNGTGVQLATASSRNATASAVARVHRTIVIAVPDHFGHARCRHSRCSWGNPPDHSSPSTGSTPISANACINAAPTVASNAGSVARMTKLAPVRPSRQNG